jgi:hypothetical protein
MKLPRRKFLHLTTGAAALSAASRFAWAQTYPARPVHIVVPDPAGETRSHRCGDGDRAPPASGNSGMRWADGLAKGRHLTSPCLFDVYSSTLPPI